MGHGAVVPSAYDVLNVVCDGTKLTGDLTQKGGCTWVLLLWDRHMSHLDMPLGEHS